MYRSSDLTDEASRLKQFAWEQWENQSFAVLFRPGTYGLDRYVVKRYIEHVLGQSDRWKQIAPYISNISQSLRAYTLTSHEVELMKKILDFHLNHTIHITITCTNDQLIEYDDLLDFIRRLQECSSNCNLSNNIRSSVGKKSSPPSIPTIHSSYVLPPSAKSMMPTPPKTSPVKPILAKPQTNTIPSTQISKSLNSVSPSVTSTTMNGNSSSQTLNNSSRLQSNIPVKPNLISPPAVNSTNPINLSLPIEMCPNSLYQAKIEGNGWVQINNVFLPFIIKNRQRLVPYQVLVSCKILENNELRSTLTRAAFADTAVMNRMIRDCKIDNEEITESALLVNVHHVLIGTKNPVYVKILSKDNPMSKINRQYKSVLALRGGSLYITNRTVPFVCSSNHSYVSLNDVLSIYPYLQNELKPLARKPHPHEIDFLQFVQMYYDEKEVSPDVLLIDMEDLNQRQIIPSKNITLIEHHAREKAKFEQQISSLNNNSSTPSSTSSTLTAKRKGDELPDNKQKSKPPSNSYVQPTTTSPTFIRPPTGYFPTQQMSSSPSSSPYASQYQRNPWLPPNNNQHGKTHWQ